MSLARLLRPGGRLVSLSSPVLANTDKAGLLAGALSSISTLARMNCSTIAKGNTVNWAFFNPSSSALDMMSRLVEENLLVPHVTGLYKFDNIVEAYREVEKGHIRGKVVVDMT